MLTSGWGAQAQKHSSLAMDLLLSQPAPPPSSDDDGPLVFPWLLRSGLVQGGAAMLTGKYPLVVQPGIAWLAMNLTQSQRDDQITFRSKHAHCFNSLYDSDYPVG